MNKERLYHIVAINEKTGNKTYLTTYPMNHKKCCIMLSKQTHYAAIRKQLEEIQ